VALKRCSSTGLPAFVVAPCERPTGAKTCIEARAGRRSAEALLHPGIPSFCKVCKVKGVGQECPTHTCKFNPNGKGNNNSKVRGVGQECPTHTGNINPNGKGNINRNVKGVGQKCPTHTCKFNPNGKGKINHKVKGVGQECPTHTCNINPNGRRKINRNVKGVGQECPTHTGCFTSLLFARSRATCSLLVFLLVLFGLDSA
jgi:hypothetical protein